MTKLEQILWNYPDEDFGLVPSGLDENNKPVYMYGEAAIGVDFEQMRIIFSVEKVIESLMADDGMEFEEALEFFDYNIRGYKSSEYKLPIWCEDLFLYDEPQPSKQN
jgi:hypothetical protein